MSSCDRLDIVCEHMFHIQEDMEEELWSHCGHMKRIGIRDLRDNATRYLAGDDVLAVERHGSLVGYFVPVTPPQQRSTIDTAIDRLRREGSPGRVVREQDGITYIVDPGWLTSVHLTAFFNEWPKRPSDEAIDVLLRGSYVVVVAMHGEDVVGFAHAYSDGRMFAYVPFVEVHPDHRRRGIGTDVMRVLLSELDGLHGVDLSCDPELVPFYERVGLEPVVAMIRRNNDVL